MHGKQIVIIEVKRDGAVELPSCGFDFRKLGHILPFFSARFFGLPDKQVLTGRDPRQFF
jgi:hypothetical protein